MPSVDNINEEELEVHSSSVFSYDTNYTELTKNVGALYVAQLLARSVQENYYDLGCVLYHLKESGDYSRYCPQYNKPNHGSWKDFCNEQLDGISYRTAQYWINLYRYFRDMGVSKEDVLKMGWSKAKELIDSTDRKEELDALITYAETHTIDEVRDHVDGLLNDAQPQAYTFQFRLYEGAGEAAREYLNEVALETNGDLNHAFFKILVEHKQLTPYFKEEATEEVVDLAHVEAVI